MKDPRAGKLAPGMVFTILVALVAAAYLPLLLGQVLYQRDVGRWLHPERAFLYSSFADADSPLWNPLIGLGLSTLANPLNEVFYPPNVLLLAVHSPRMTSLFLFAHILIGAAGMMALLRHLGRDAALPALVAALAWGLSAITTSEVTAGLRLIASAYIPWSALGMIELSRTVRAAASMRACIRAVAGAAIPLGLCFLTGEIFFPFLAAVFALGVAVGDALETKGSAKAIALRPWAWRLGLGVCVAAALAAGSAAVVLLPAKHAAQDSARTAPLARETAEVGSFHPWRLAEMIAPGAMGDPYTAYPAGQWVGEVGLGQRPLLYGCYVGSSILALALMAFGRGRRLSSSLGVLAALALLVAFGRHTGAHAIVRTLIPPLAYMRGPEKYLSVFVACVSLLAGLGTARLLENPQRLWTRGLFVVASLVVLAIIASWFPPALAEQVRSSALTGLAFAVAATAVAWICGRSGRGAGWILVAVVFVDLAHAVFALQNLGSPELLAAKPNAATAILAGAYAQGALAPPRVYRSEVADAAIEATAAPDTVAQVQRNLVRTLIDNHAGSFGIASVPGYDAAMPATLSTLWLAGRASGLDLLRLTGVEYAILPTTYTDSPDLRPILDPVPGVRLFHVNDVLPRVYVASAAAVLPDSLARQAVFAPDVVAGRQVILAPNPTPPASTAVGEPVAKEQGSCRLTAFAHAHLAAECQTATPALAVFLEQFDTGWTARVDGQRAELLRANLTMRAVPLRAGRHQIELSFSPPGLTTGLTISLASLLVLVAAFLLGRRRPVEAAQRLSKTL